MPELVKNKHAESTTAPQCSLLVLFPRRSRKVVSYRKPTASDARSPPLPRCIGKDSAPKLARAGGGGRRNFLARNSPRLVGYGQSHRDSARRSARARPDLGLRRSFRLVEKNWAGAVTIEFQICCFCGIDQKRGRLFASDFKSTSRNTGNEGKTKG